MAPIPTFQPVGFYKDVNGMSQATAAHMIPEGTWFSTFNAQFFLGRIVQTPPELQLFELQDPEMFNVGYSALAVLVQDGVSSLILALSTGDNSVIVDFTDENATPVDIGPYATTDDSGDFRIEWVTSAGVVYFCSPINGLYQYPGVSSPPDIEFVITSGLNYFPKYVEIYYGHLVIANLIHDSDVFPLRVAWSDKDDFRDFDPTTTNESDFFEVDDNAQNALYGFGITGCKKLGDLLCVHTPGSIWNVRYVGFDAGVMDITQRVSGIGCWLPHALIAFDQYHIFPARDDFYVYDGATLQPIGQDIKQFFFNDLSKDPRVRQRVWSDVDIERQELRWYYPSTLSTGECDKCLVLNWPTRSWYVETGFGRNCVLHAGVNNTLRTIDGLSKLESTINALVNISVTIDGLALSSVLGFTVFAKETDNFCYRNLTTDDYLPSAIVDTRTITYPQIELISRDYDFTKTTEVKDIDSIVFDAEINPITLVTAQLPLTLLVFMEFPPLTLRGTSLTLPDAVTPYPSPISITFYGQIEQLTPEGNIGFVRIFSDSDRTDVLYENTYDEAGPVDTFTFNLNEPTYVFVGTFHGIYYLPVGLNNFEIVVTNFASLAYRWDLYVSTREKFSNPVVFDFQGSYSLDMVPDRVTQPRLAGKICRFKFTTKNLVNCAFLGYSPILYAGTSEK